MEPTKEQLSALIQELPCSDERKKNLLTILEEEDGVKTVTIILRTALEESALKTSFKENVVQADGSLQSDMTAIEKDGMELGNEIAKEMDADQLKALKDQITG